LTQLVVVLLLYFSFFPVFSFVNKKTKEYRAERKYIVFLYAAYFQQDALNKKRGISELILNFSGFLLVQGALHMSNFVEDYEYILHSKGLL